MTPTLTAAAVRLSCRLAALLLPWTNRSQHDAWVQGYREGVRDASRRETR